MSTSGCYHDRHPTTDQIGGERRQPIILPPCPAILDGHVLAFNKSGLIEPSMETGDKVRKLGRRLTIKKSNHRQRRLLSPGRNWPRRRAPEQGDELAAGIHSITSSARASSVAGISRPRPLAVLRLITSSYLVGACTGSSTGLSPRRMRST